MRHKGIHARLVLAAFFLISSAMMLMVAMGMHTTKRFMTKRFQDRMAFLAKYLALNSELGVLIGDKETLKQLSTNLLSEDDVVRVSILDEKGNILIDVGNTDQTHFPVISQPVLFQQKGGGELLFGTTPHVTDLPPRKIGEVKVFFTTSGIHELIKTMTVQYVLSSSALIIISAICFFFVSRSIIREITALVATARKVAKGQIDMRAEPGKLPEISELASVFNSMLDSLAEKHKALVEANRVMVKQKALAEVGKFSLMVAHEVKNPLSIIKSSLEMLKEDLAISSDNPMVVYIEDEIRRLNKLIEDFLIFARPSEIELRPVNLNEMAREVAERVKYLDGNGAVEIIQDIPEGQCLVDADPELLTGALWNIVKNGCEATEGNGKLWIKVYEDKSSWIIEVRDNGEGIPEDNIERIFDPFFTTKAKGTGLGLAFALQVVTAHGGDITARNADTGGAEFRVIIPKRTADYQN